MDIEKFVKKQDSALKRYRRLYILLDLAVIWLVLYTLFVVLNMDTLFPLISTFELYVGTTYDLFGNPVKFETLGLMAAAMIAALLLTTLLHIKDRRSKTIQLVESKYPILQERLSTAYDNRNRSNVVIDDLKGGVLNDARQVKSSQFLNRKRLGIVFGALLITSSVFAYVTINDWRTEVSPEDFPNIVERIPGISQGDQDQEELLPELGQDGNEGSGNEELFGEPAIIVIEGTEVDLTLPPGSGTGFTMGEEGEERTGEFERSSAYDINVIASQAYYEELPEGYQNVIKTYFEELAEE